MSTIQTMTLEQYHEALRSQGVSAREHAAVKCPICGTVQSLADLLALNVAPERAERSIGYSCIGRFTNAGPWRKGEPPGRGCDWTLGGLFQLHKLAVQTPDGKTVPAFEPATPNEAQAHERAKAGVVPVEGQSSDRDAGRAAHHVREDSQGLGEPGRLSPSTSGAQVCMPGHCDSPAVPCRGRCINAFRSGNAGVILDEGKSK